MAHFFLSRCPGFVLLLQAFLLLGRLIVLSNGFAVGPNNGGSRRSLPCCSSALYQSNNNNEQSGYKFGDMTRFLAKKATDKVNDLTGKDAYQFGDLSRYLDQRAKDRVMEAKGALGSGGDPYKYEFGDLTRWADALAKQKAANFAGKETAGDDRFGDRTKTIVRKVQSGEYQLDDVYLALRVLLTAGFSILPVAHLLPIRMVLQLVNFGLAKDIGDRVMGVLVVSLDARIKQALTGNAAYQLGDWSKDRIRQSVTSFTGKDRYEFGDLTLTVARLRDSRSTSKIPYDKAFRLDDQVADEFERWDSEFHKHFGQSTAAVEKLANEELEVWDRKFSNQQQQSPKQ
jgi:hypothetical protein